MRWPDVTRSLLLVGSLACGAAIAHAMMPYMFHSIPFASMRVEMILNALHRHDVKPQTVVFGSSITATGVDPGALSRTLPGNPTVLNLAAPAQSVAEAVLLYQELPDSARVVVQELAPWELVTQNPFAPNKVNSYYNFGYRPSERTIAILGDVFGERTAVALRSSETLQTFRSRWVLSRLLDLSFWLNLRTQLAMEDTARDGSFYVAEQGRVDDPVMETLLRQWSSMFANPNPEIFAAKRRLVEHAVTELRRSGRRVLVYVPPIHPRIRAHITPPFSDWFDALLDAARGAGADCVNLSANEPEGEFHDALHMSAGAAGRTTRAIARRLAEG